MTQNLVDINYEKIGQKITVIGFGKLRWRYLYMIEFCMLQLFKGLLVTPNNKYINLR